MSFESRSAIVTGAGSGIGLAIARGLVERGARVLVADIAADRIEPVVEELGSNAVAVVVDVSKEADVLSMIDRARTAFGRVDVLFNNAGVLDGMTPLAEVTDALWQRTMAVNVDGVFYACRRAVPLMLEQGGGVIVNTASVAGLAGGRAGFAYTVSKHALVGITRSIAYFYGPRGIRCNAVCPGAVLTRIIESTAEVHPEGLQRIQETFPTMPAPADPADVARVALFLASDEARNVNGVVLNADSGWFVA